MALFVESNDSGEQRARTILSTHTSQTFCVHERSGCIVINTYTATLAALIIRMAREKFLNVWPLSSFEAVQTRTAFVAFFLFSWRRNFHLEL